MRALEKSDPPHSVVQNGPEWTREFIDSGRVTTPWARNDVKEALSSEVANRCAYCEGEFLSVSFGDIEHMKPKSVFPELVVDWPNLTLACSRCNSRKGSTWDDELPFLDPYVDEIPNHLVFAGPIVYGRSHRGDFTLETLELNHAARVEARDRVLRSVEALFRSVDGAPVTARRRARVLIQAQLDGPYSAAVRSYVEARGGLPTV